MEGRYSYTERHFNVLQPSEPLSHASAEVNFPPPARARFSFFALRLDSLFCNLLPPLCSDEHGVRRRRLFRR